MVARASVGITKAITSLDPPINFELEKNVHRCGGTSTDNGTFRPAGAVDDGLGSVACEAECDRHEGLRGMFR